MSYFKDFPLAYIDSRIITDFFAHVSIRDNETNDSIYDYLKYNIQNGERPDIVSHKLYNTVDYWWTFFVINTKLREGLQAWPKSSSELTKSLAEEYDNKVSIIFPYHYTITPFGTKYNTLYGVPFDEKYLPYLRLVYTVSPSQKYSVKILSYLDETAQLIVDTTSVLKNDTEASDITKIIWDKDLVSSRVYTIEIDLNTPADLKAEWTTTVLTDQVINHHNTASSYYFTAVDHFNTIHAPAYFIKANDSSVPIPAFDAYDKTNPVAITNFVSWETSELEANDALTQIKVIRPSYIDTFSRAYKQLLKNG